MIKKKNYKQRKNEKKNVSPAVKKKAHWLYVFEKTRVSFCILVRKTKVSCYKFWKLFCIWSVAFYLNFWWPLFTFIRVQQYNMKVCYCSRYNPTLGVVLLIFKSTASKREGAVSSYWWHCYPKLSTMTPRRASCDSCWHHVQGSERFVGGCCDP